MQIIEYRGLKIELDDEGYLINSDEWSEDVANAIAEIEGIKELTKDKMDIINFLREYYKKHNAFPSLKLVCRNVHQLGDCISAKFGSPQKAWKIAGLPKLTGETLSYLLGGF